MTFSNSLVSQCCHPVDSIDGRVSCEGEINKSLVGLRSLKERSAVELFGGLIGSIGRIDIVRNTEVRLAWTLVASNASEFRFGAIDLDVRMRIARIPTFGLFFSSAKHYLFESMFISLESNVLKNFRTSTMCTLCIMKIV